MLEFTDYLVGTVLSFIYEKGLISPDVDLWALHESTVRHIMGSKTFKAALCSEFEEDSKDGD